jgi:hypothetical protein
VLDVGHPDTLMTMNNLARVLGSQGKYDDAEPMYRKTLATSEKVLGVEHPDTLMPVYGLAHLLVNQYQYTEYNVLYKRACAGYGTTLRRDHPTNRTCHQHYFQALSCQKQDPLDVPLKICPQESPESHDFFPYC